MNLRARVPAAAVVAATFLLLLPSPTALDLIVGAVAALLALRLGRAGDRVAARAWQPARLGALPAAAPLLARALLDALAGAARVLLAVLGVRTLATPGLVELPFGERTPEGAALNGLLITLSPGSLLVDFDYDARVLVFHVVGTDAAAFRRAADRLYRLQRRIVP